MCHVFEHSQQSTSRVILSNTKQDLIKNIQDFKVEIIELKKSQMASSSKTIKGLKGFVQRYMQYDNSNYNCGECDSYKIAIKDGIIYFKEDKITLTRSKESLSLILKKVAQKNW